MLELSNCLWVPLSGIDKDREAALRKQLTVTVQKLDGTKATVVCLREDREGWLGLPRVFGLKSFANQRYADLRTRGRKVRFPKQVSLRDYQVPFVESIMDACATRTDFIVEAGTGKGKTVCGLAVIARRGMPAVVIVDQENLLEQWRDRCIEHLGLHPDDIGIVQGPGSDYKGKAVVICMVQTLTRREQPEDFYTTFGTAIFDESHTSGARTFSRTLMMFCAEVRFGLSATPDRRDAFQKLLQWNLGTVDVSLTDDHEQSNVYIMESHGVYSWSANNSSMASRFISEIADDGLRNLRLAQATQWLYESGRDVLVISDRVEQLCSLLALCRALGMPAQDMGIYAKRQTVWAYERDPRPARKPEHLEKGAEYTPIRLALLEKTVKKPRLNEVKERCRVIFATYGIIAKGVDIPRLSAGVDATPRRQATQVHGRILRTAPGKLRPIWITTADTNSFRSLFQLIGRLDDYEDSNAEVFLWDSKKGRKKQDVAALRRELKERVVLLQRSKIVTALDGNNTLLIQSTPTGSGS